MIRYTLVIQCSAAGCFEGDKEQYMGTQPSALFAESWAQRERKGWTLQRGKHLCPKHVNYLKEEDIRSMIEPSAWRDWQDNIGEMIER